MFHENYNKKFRYAISRYSWKKRFIMPPPILVVRFHAFFMLLVNMEKQIRQKKRKKKREKKIILKWKRPERPSPLCVQRPDSSHSARFWYIIQMVAVAWWLLQPWRSTKLLLHTMFSYLSRIHEEIMDSRIRGVNNRNLVISLNFDGRSLPSSIWRFRTVVNFNNLFSLDWPSTMYFRELRYFYTSREKREKVS